MNKKLLVHHAIWISQFISIISSRYLKIKKKGKSGEEKKLDAGQWKSPARTTRANISSWTTFHLTRWHRKIITLHWSFCFSFGSISRCMQHWARPSRRINASTVNEFILPRPDLVFPSISSHNKSKTRRKECSETLPLPFVINLWNNAGKVQKWTNETSRKPSLSISYSLSVFELIACLFKFFFITKEKNIY